jgi:hypothetical protein
VFCQEAARVKEGEMHIHPSVSDTMELYTRKLQAVYLMAALRHARGATAPSEGDSLAIKQGIELFDRLIDGQRLFSEDKVTKHLVTAGAAFLAAARSLNKERRDQMKDCVTDLNLLRTHLVEISRSNWPAEDEITRIMGFLGGFTRVLQSEIDAKQIPSHKTHTPR